VHADLLARDVHEPQPVALAGERAAFSEESPR
jgi:hypothetical protein